MLFARFWSALMAATPGRTPPLSSSATEWTPVRQQTSVFSASVRAIGTLAAVREFTVQPALGVGPVTLGASQGDSQHGGGVRHRQAAEIAKGHQPRRDRVQS